MKAKAESSCKFLCDRTSPYTPSTAFLASALSPIKCSSSLNSPCMPNHTVSFCTGSDSQTLHRRLLETAVKACSSSWRELQPLQSKDPAWLRQASKHFVPKGQVTLLLTATLKTAVKQYNTTHALLCGLMQYNAVLLAGSDRAEGFALALASCRALGKWSGPAATRCCKARSKRPRCISMAWRLRPSLGAFTSCCSSIKYSPGSLWL